MSHRFLANRAVVAATTLLILGAVAAAPVAATRWVPKGLSASDLRAALQSMSPDERDLRRTYFTSSRYVVVAYSRLVQSFDAATGIPRPHPRGLMVESTPLSLAGITNLTLSIAVTYDREAPPYRWDISNYFDWTGKPPYNGNGKDQIATACANGLALHSDYAHGKYTNGSSISMSRNDMTPNVGTSWEFSECNAAYCNSYANYGYLLATIKESSLHGQDTNVVFKYFHTYASTEYSIGFSGGGPSISISPTSNQVSTAVYRSFRN